MFLQIALFQWKCFIVDDLDFSSRMFIFCEYLITLEQRGKNRLGD